jgi:hypothetical protein
MENLKGKITHELLSKFSHLPAEYHNFGYIWPSKHTLIELDTLPLKDLAEPFVKRLICDGHYKNGNPCRNKAIIGNQCKLHQKSGCLPICSAICKTGKQCRNKAKNDSECCGVHKK